MNDKELCIDSMEYLDTISVELATRCNLQCRMCSHPTNQRKPHVMTVDQFKRILKKIKNTKIRNLFFNMGEPFMNRWFFMMASIARREGFSVYVSTNGMLLTENHINNILKTGIKVLKFSIEGYTPETYHSIRIGGDFERLVKNVTMLKEQRDRSGSSLRIRISTILMKGNENLVEFIKFWGPYCDEIEYTTMTDHIGLMENREISLSSRWNQRKACPQVKPYNEINVLADGDMVICCVDFLGKCILGNLLEQELEAIWYSEKMTEVRTKAYSNLTHELEPCDQCSIADYSEVFWKQMRHEVNVIHDAVKNNMWDILRQVKSVKADCPLCGQLMRVSYGGVCLQCLEKKLVS